MTKLFAICHDGTMNGDCSGDPMSTIDITDLGFNDISTISFDDVIKPMYMNDWCDNNCTDEESDPGWFASERKSIKGAWIIKEDTFKLMEAVVDAADPGNDSAVYGLQRALKAIAKHLAIATVGKAPK